LRRLALPGRLAPLSRCLRCPGALAAVSPAAVLGPLAPLPRRSSASFRRCFGCGRLSWPGSPPARLVRLVARLRAPLPPSPCPARWCARR
ncbi:hypothetical protein C3R44_23350, partial [Mycobacterium tuberculosis]